MNWILAGILLAISPSISEGVKEFCDQAKTYVDPEAAVFLKNLYQEPSENPPKCNKCLSSPINHTPPESNVMVFMSFSVPLESWKDWSYSLEKKGGVFVLRGLPGNSFEIFASKIKELRNSGVNTPIIIDPESFEKYSVLSVPSVVILSGQKYDKITGNVSLETVWRLVSENGSTKKIVQRWTN